MKENIVLKNGMVFTDDLQHMWEIDFLKNNKKVISFENKNVNRSFLNAKKFLEKNHPELLL